MKMPWGVCPTAVALVGLACLLIVQTAAAQDDLQLPADRDNFHLFLLVGQSNMAGRGQVSDADRQPHPRVLSLDKDGNWIPAVDPLHFDKPKIVGVGPGRAFGVAYAEAHPEVTVGLIPCAVGGSPIDAWQPGAFYEPTQSHPYDDMLRRAGQAQSAGVLRGILWHQGESDAKPEASRVYLQKLVALAARLRQELNAPQAAFLIGQLGQFAERPWDESRRRVDQAHRQAVRMIPNSAFVAASGLQHKGDEVHFDAQSARELGRRYFQSAQWLETCQPVLRLSPGDGNPRNSEGDFIRLKNGQWKFIYTRFSAGTSDHAAAQLVSRTSHDGGASWSDEDQPEVANEGQWNVMSVSLLRLADGRIALFYMRKNSLSDCRPVLRISDDETATWSDPVEIVPDDQMGYYVLNNDRVIQLQDGRIVVPLALHNRPGQDQPDWAGQITSFHSDDAGQTWQASQTLQKAFTADTQPRRIMAQEPGVIEMADGRLQMWIRTDAGEQYRCWSDDRGETWGKFEPMGLASPRSPASIERIPGTADWLAVWNDHSHLAVKERTQRTPLCFAISQNQGHSWSEPQVLAADPQGWYCYTAIDFADDQVLFGHVAGTQAPDQHLATSELKRLPLDSLYRQAGLVRLVKVQRIWNAAKHNAFTDLIRFQNQWLCVFREGTGHVSDDGALRVISSPDGNEWESAALITSNEADLRDAKITLTPTGQLMLSGAGAMHDTSQFKHQSMSWFSEDGKQWSDAFPIGDRDNWLWRTTWHAGVAYGLGYQTNSTTDRSVRLYKSDDGKHFQTLVGTVFDQGYPNESSLVFLDDGTSYCLLRRDAAEQTGQWGTSSPPYTQWSWQDLGVRIGGPHMIRLPDGRIVAAVRLYDGKVRTSLCWIDPQGGKLTEFLPLPSGGDTSYAGLVWHDEYLWVSYYSAHEANAEVSTAIYFAQVALPRPK